ncbi:hypothetical protein KQJ29_35615, partial [Enterococcus sp. S181_ASV_20]|nr:hypothetical protein [Enterococcus sp. S181_ASV_20]
YKRQDEIIKRSEEKMPITIPKAIVGIKGLAELPKDNKERLIFKISMDLLFQMLLGTTSQNYLRLYNCLLYTSDAADEV